MALDFRFAIASDLHLALPHTIWDHPSRFHLVEVSIPSLEAVLEHLAQLDIDFLLIPGDLTQHGEPDNHTWLQERLGKLPFPVYVIPGNHDVPNLLPNSQSIGLDDFPFYYRPYGYGDGEQLYYSLKILPQVRLIGLNSNMFDDRQQQLGRLDDRQLAWLEAILAKADEEVIMVMIHHNIIEHLPGQSHHAMGRRYMLDNAPLLLQLLQKAGVNLVFTGHLHAQDVAYQQGVYDITTGSLVSYPHPYRILHFYSDFQGKKWLKINSHRVESLPEWPHLAKMSREWMGDRSFAFMLRLLTESPLNLPVAEAKELAPSLRYFWADIAQGDGIFDFPHFPPKVRRYFQTFSATNNGFLAGIDNSAILPIA